MVLARKMHHRHRINPIAAKFSTSCGGALTASILSIIPFLVAVLPVMPRLGVDINCHYKIGSQQRFYIKKSLFDVVFFLG